MNPKWGQARRSLGQRARRPDEHIICAIYVQDHIFEITGAVFELVEFVDL